MANGLKSWGKLRAASAGGGQLRRTGATGCGWADCSRS